MVTLVENFFHNYEEVSKITGIDEDFIKRLYVILQTISSKHCIDIQAFKKYCLETARLYVKKYNWYPMPSSCHALLIHGPAVIETFSISVGLLSEESQEGRNKDFKRCHENNTRKARPELTNDDIMRYLLVSSDHYIFKFRFSISNKVKELLEEAKALLILDTSVDPELSDSSLLD